MKKVFNKLVFIMKQYKVACTVIGIVIIGVFLTVSNVFGELTPIKSIEIFSEQADFSKKEPGSWKITKSAKWVSKGTAEITFDVDTVLKTENKNADVLFVLDISGSMSLDKLNRVKADSIELIESLLSNNKNKAGLITFETNSSIVSELTSDKEQLISSIQNLTSEGNTNYYQSLINVDKILKNYTKEDDKDIIVLFLTDGYPNEDTPNEVGFFNYLKSAYPYVTFNAVQYEMGSVILEPITKVSDNQYLADMETLNNVLFDASVKPITYDNFEISDFIDTRYFYVDSDKDIKSDIGGIIFDKTSQKVTWKIDNLKSGSKEKLTIKVRIKTELIGVGGIYPTNEHEEIISKIESIEENVNSKETPVLADNYKVVYESNAPDGCSVEGAPSEETHSVFDTVGISEAKPTCEGYQFKGWDIVTESAKKINDDYFIMPEDNVTIRGNWSSLSLQKSMDGTVKESLTLYKQVQNDVNDSTKFAKKYTGDTSTFTGDQEVYYYYGSASGNNVLFANYCWKIIRTTDTGGVKLLYNGVPDASGACNNTGTNSALTKEQMNTSSANVAFNSSSSSPADVGYMYNTRYTYNQKSFSTGSPTMISTRTMSNSETYNYYYSDTYTYTNSRYTMEEPSQYIWTDNYESLVGKYTCMSTSASTASCLNIYYVAKAESGKMYYITLSSGNDLAVSSTIIFSDAITANEDGAYTLTNPVEVNRLDWYTNYETYNNYYTCGSNEITCTVNTMKKVTSTSSTAYSYIALSGTYRYGNSFIWDGENYTLTDTVDSLGIPSDISTHLYTCWDTTGVCNKINYVYDEDDAYGYPELYYITLSDGKSIDDALNEMLYNDDVNTNNSNVKTIIDYWYANSMTEYTSYLEDTVWCNDRSISDIKNYGASMDLRFKSNRNRVDLTCKNKNDRFTVNEVNGNGFLIYPVGLIDATETSLAYIDTSPYSPHASGSAFMSLSPDSFDSGEIANYFVSSYGSAANYNRGSYRHGVRPAISLRAGIEYSSGDGSSDKPFGVDLDIDNNLYVINIDKNDNYYIMSSSAYK